MPESSVLWLMSPLWRVEVLAPAIAWFIQWYFGSKKSGVRLALDTFVIFAAYLFVYR
jgi:hypothetical protein